MKILVAALCALYPISSSFALDCVTPTASSSYGCNVYVMCPDNYFAVDKGTCVWNVEGCGSTAEQFIVGATEKKGWECTGETTGDNHDVSVTVACCRAGGAPTETQTETAVATATATASEIQTQTQTQSATATSTSTTSSSSTTTTDKSGPKGSSSSSSDEGDDEHQASAMNLLDGSAKQVLTLGAVDCLDGANELLEDEAAGQEKLGACMRTMAEGKAVKDQSDEAARRAGRAGLGGSMVDDKILESDRAKAVLEKFEKNFSASGEDLVRKMLGSGASLDELREALLKKFPEDKVAELMSGAENMKFAVDHKGKAKAELKTGKASTLREQIKEGLAQAGNVPAVRAPAAKSSKPDFVATPDDLTPLKDPLFSGLDQEREEISIFEVVRRKYRDKWDLMIHYKKQH